MLHATGFELEKCLASDRSCELQVARSDAYDGPVLLSRFTGGSLESRASRASREVELLGALAGPGVPRVLERVDATGDPVLVLDHVSGRWLGDVVASAPLGPLELVDLGAHLAELLARMHAQRWLHLGLDPARIWIVASGGAPRILDFAWARRFGARHADPEHGGEPRRRHGLSFISPEQTGRMGRGVDSRSDLYALGACLYFAATGRAPFEGDDPLALMHAHLARQPVPAVEVRPELPATLSRIISRLLQKSPEARYQVATAVEADLRECRAQLERTGSISDDLVLGTADAPYRPLFSKVLYGREREEAALADAFADAQNAIARVSLLSGVAGAGKSSLVDGLRQRVTRAGGYLAQGKFDLYRVDLPYSGIAAALGSVVHQLLTESDERLAAWRAKLLAELGGAASALVGVVPEIELVLPDLPPAGPVGAAQSLARLSLAVQRFVGAMAEPEHPIVLFIDDLQWADAASRDVLRTLLTQQKAGAFLFIGAYRSEEVGESHPLSAWIGDVVAGPVRTDELALAPLDLEASTAMLADALGRPPDDTRALAELIARKTANNPLLIHQFVAHLVELGLISFSAGAGWSWDDAEIAAAGVVDDAVRLLAARITRLPEVAAHVLELAALVGDSFAPDRLHGLTDRSAGEIEAALFTLADEGLVAPCADGFRFVHDRIREAAQQRIEGARAAELHYAIAQRLIAETPSERLDEHAFEIADHLGPVLDRAIAADRDVVLDVYARAGDRAVRAGAARTALRYLEVAVGLSNVAHDPIASAAEIHLNAAEAACQLEEYARAEAFVAPLAGRDLPPLLDARVGAKRIQILTMSETQRSVGEPLPPVLAMLREYGVRWPEAPSMAYSRIVVHFTDWLLRGPLGEGAFEPSRSDPSGWLPELILLSAAAPVLQARSGRSTCLTCALSLRLYRKFGYIGSPAISLAGYAAYRRTVVGHTRGMARYADAALEWADRCPDPTLAARCRFVVYAFVKPWIEPRRAAIDPLEAVCHALRELGDLEFALYAASQRANYVALGGATLERVEREFRGVEERAGRVALEAYPVLADVCGYLRAALPDEAALEARIRQFDDLFSAVPATRMACWPFWLLTLCLLGRYEEAHAAAERAATWAFDAAATPAQLVDFVLVRGIAAAELARVERSGRRARLRILRRSERMLRVWSRGSAQFEHMVQALAAERASLSGRGTAAVQTYRVAADAAASVGHVHYAAWFRERAARTLVRARRDVEAARELRRAVSAYAEWGAKAKADALASELDQSLLALGRSGAP